MNRSIGSGDRAGIVVAVACAVHCVVAPVLGASLQAVGALASDQTELLFLTVSLAVSGTTVVANCLRHAARRAAVVAFAFGASLLVCARAGVAWIEPAEQSLVITGAGMVIAAHLINLANCRCKQEGPSCVGVE